MASMPELRSRMFQVGGKPMFASDHFGLMAVLERR